jgi:hypothetical protein
MSRGPGKMQQHILDTLRSRSEPTSATALRSLYELGIEVDLDLDKLSPSQKRSVRMSMDRALRQLKASSHIKRDESGNWYPAKDWTARDDKKRALESIAYHEAGHAVVGLALKLPIAFVTMKPRASSLGHVSQAPVHHGVGKVYARGSYLKPIADMAEEDAFGNPESRRNGDWHADIVMSIAGGMAQAEFLKDDRTWRELEGTVGDRRSVAFARRKLGDKARGVEEYEAECGALIRRYWPMIEAVAAKLMKEETLSGGDVYDVCWRTIRSVVRRQHLKRKRGK